MTEKFTSINTREPKVSQKRAQHNGVLHYNTKTLTELKENQLTTDPGLHSQARWTPHLFPQTSFPVQLWVRDNQEYYTTESDVSFEYTDQKNRWLLPSPLERALKRISLWRQVSSFHSSWRNLLIRVALTEGNNLLQKMKTFWICEFLIVTLLGATSGSGRNTNKEGMFC